MEINWLSYIIVIVITTFIVAIITENVVIDRFQMSEGVYIMAGRCRLRPGYGKLTGPDNEMLANQLGQNNIYSNNLLEQEQLINTLQKDIQMLKDRLEGSENINQHNINHPEGFQNRSYGTEGFKNHFYRPGTREFGF